ncbi:hypothetical protein V3C99_018587 [Haemonchus contortus]
MSISSLNTMPISQDYSRAITCFEWLCDTGVTTTVHNINSAMGEDTTSNATAHRWFARFKEGNTGFEDKARSGPPPPRRRRFHHSRHRRRGS